MCDVSIVISVFNGERYIDNTISEIISQSFKNFEVIIVNDGSTDNTLELLERYRKLDSRIKIINQENTGQGPARNAGIAMAQGKYLLVLDADDRFEPTLLEKLYTAAERASSDITICKSLDFDDSTNLKQAHCYAVNTAMCPAQKVVNATQIKDYIFNFSIGWAWDKLYRLDFVKKNNLTFPDLRHSEDLVFVFGAYCYNPKIFVLDDVLIYHRVNNNKSVSSSRSNSPLLFIDAVRMLMGIMDRQRVQEAFRKSFVNWIVQFFYWHLDTIDHNNKKNVLKEINKFFKNNNFYAYEMNYFYDTNLFLRLNNAKKSFFSIRKTHNSTRYNIFGIELYKIKHIDKCKKFYVCGICVYRKKIN